MSQKIEPKTLFCTPDAVAAVLDSADVFGLLSRSLELPPDWTALVTREQGDQVLHAAGSTLSDNDSDQITLVRTSPLMISFESLRATTVDHYQCNARLSLRVSIVPERGELQSFAKSVLGSARSVTRDDVARYLSPHVSNALAKCAEGRGVEVLIDANQRDAFAAELREGVKAAAFAGGLKLEGSWTLEIDSPLYRQVRRHRAEAQRRREELDAQQRIKLAAQEAQKQHAEHLANLLTELREQADKTDNVDLHDLLKTYSEADRGEIYAALFATGQPSRETQSIVVGSGDRLIFFSPLSFNEPQRSVPLPNTVGPVRSVHSFVDPETGPRLLVGASYGVYELGVEDTDNIVTYSTERTRQVRGGINATVLAGDRIWATHSELGVLCWPRDRHDEPDRVLADLTERAQTVRCATQLDSEVYFAIDQNVYRMRADDPTGEPGAWTGSQSVITALCPTTDHVYAGNAQGQLLVWESGSSRDPKVLHSGRERGVESITLQELGGVRRLIFADTSLAIFARVVGDSFACRYEANGQTLLRVEAASDIIVATNEVRDRLICWSSGSPATPSGVVSVSRLTGHSIQDVCLI